MKALKIGALAVLVAVAGVIGVLFYGVYNLDSIIKDAIEKYGSEAAGVQVTLNEVDVELKKGRIELVGLEVANPPGYSKPSLFSLGRIALQVKPESLTGHPIVIDEITIDQPKVVVEQKNLKTSNLSDLAANLKKRQSSSESQETKSTSGGGEEPIIAVTAFNFNRASLLLSSEQFGEKAIEMPSFTASNIGGSTGLPPSQLAVALLSEVVKQGSQAAKNGFREFAQTELKDRAQELIDKNLSDEDKNRVNAVKSLLGR